MAKHGLTEILMRCPVVSMGKIIRIRWRIEQIDHFSTVVDGPGNIDPLQNAAASRDGTVNVVLEIDAGVNRCGVPPGEAASAVSHPPGT